MSLKVNVKGQRSKAKVTMDKTAFFGPFGGPSAAYVWQNVFSL